MRAFAAIVASTALFCTVGVAPAAASSHTCDRESKEDCPLGKATDDGFGVEIGRNDRQQGAPVRPVSGGEPATRYTEKLLVPTCTGNSSYDSGVLCNAAIESCPDGEIRFWVFTREVTIATNERTAWQRVTNPPTVCVGASDPAIDPAVAIPAMVQRDFKSVVVMKGVAEVSPKPDTLVNIPTVFTTSAPASYDIPLTLLGQSVVITAKAERYTWHFGDGHTGTTTRPGGRVEHEYTQAAPREAYVVIEWSGSFRVNGGASQSINGTATTTGDPIAVEVKQARTELVRD